MVNTSGSQKRYRAVLFDLDGTLVDTAPGILACYRHAFAAVGRPAPADECLRGAIGFALSEALAERFGLPPSEVRTAVAAYRRKYVEIGTAEAAVYRGIPELLAALRRAGYLLGVATLKGEAFARSMLEHFGLAGYFNHIAGTNSADSLTKAEIVLKCLRALAVEPELALLVGDSDHDAGGARAAGVDFAGVLYGYGFADAASLAGHKPVFSAAVPPDLADFLVEPRQARHG